MKRKAFTYLIAGVTFLSGFGGAAALLGNGMTAAEVEPAARIQLDQTEPAPMLIASGCPTGDESEKESGSTQGCGTTQDGNSWGG